MSNDLIEVFFLFADGQEIMLPPNAFLNLLSVVKNPKFINFRFLEDYNDKLLAGITGRFVEKVTTFRFDFYLFIKFSYLLSLDMSFSSNL